jgi:hypothetical protein
MNALISTQAPDFSHQSFLVNGHVQRNLLALNPNPCTSFDLVVHIDCAGRIVTDNHDAKAWHFSIPIPEIEDVLRYFTIDPRRQSDAINDTRLTHIEVLIILIQRGSLLENYGAIAVDKDTALRMQAQSP